MGVKPSRAETKICNWLEQGWQRLLEFHKWASFFKRLCVFLFFFSSPHQTLKGNQRRASEKKLCLQNTLLLCWRVFWEHTLIRACECYLITSTQKWGRLVLFAYRTRSGWLVLQWGRAALKTCKVNQTFTFLRWGSELQPRVASSAAFNAGSQSA